jgi:transcriptional regulator with XRE-family HTH domain
MHPTGVIIVDVAIDSPLRRWRGSQGMTQAGLAERLGVRVTTVARWEQEERTPRGDQLLRLMEVTGLSAEALMFPKLYLQHHPEFLAEWSAQPPRRGRPRRQPPEEEQPE